MNAERREEMEIVARKGMPVHSSWLAELLAALVASEAKLADTLEQLRNAEAAVTTAEERAAAYSQMMWDALGILGFDLDGNPTPAARVGWPDHFLRDIREARKDHDEAWDEAVTQRERAEQAEQRAANAEGERDMWEQRFTAVLLRNNENWGRAEAAEQALKEHQEVLRDMAAELNRHGWGNVELLHRVRRLLSMSEHSDEPRAPEHHHEG